MYDRIAHFLQNKLSSFGGLLIRRGRCSLIWGVCVAGARRQSTPLQCIAVAVPLRSAWPKPSFLASRQARRHARFLILYNLMMYSYEEKQTNTKFTEIRVYSFPYHLFSPWVRASGWWQNRFGLIGLLLNCSNFSVWRSITFVFGSI